MAGPVQWNFTIDDASPMFTYSPYGDVPGGHGLQSGWQTWYTGSNYITNNSLGASPVGESFHLTSLSGASVSLSFYGTGIALYGSANCSYDVTVDGKPFRNATLVQGVFFSESNLLAGDHNVTLTARPNDGEQILSFDQAIVTSVANGTGNSPTDLVINNQNTSVITYLGDWTPSKIVTGVPSSQSSAPFHSTTSFGASAILNFTGRTIALYGSSTTSHGQYAVTLDNQRRIFNATSEWLLGNMLMFFEDGLDENATHSLNITNFSSDEALSLSSVEIKQFVQIVEAPATTIAVHKQLNVGVVAGPVIAFVTVFAVAGLCFWMKRRTRHSPKTLGRRSGLTSSSLLPCNFRRTDDLVTPFVSCGSTSSNMQRSREASTMGAFNFDHSYGNLHSHDEKSQYKATHHSFNIDSIGAFPTADRRPPLSDLAIVVPSTDIVSPGAVRSSIVVRHNSVSPRSTGTGPILLASSDAVSPGGQSSQDPEIVERILTLVAQRIDLQRMPHRHDSQDDSVVDLPPYSAEL